VLVPNDLSAAERNCVRRAQILVSVSIIEVGLRLVREGLKLSRLVDVFDWRSHLWIPNVIAIVRRVAWL
jgi:hypothetical protein